MDEIIAATTLADSTKTYTSNGPFTVLADGLQGTERIELQRTGPSGVPSPATGGNGKVFLTKDQNTLPVPTTTGAIVWTFIKPQTKNAVSVAVTA